jgi:hypothetical protein
MWVSSLLCNPAIQSAPLFILSHSSRSLFVLRRQAHLEREREAHKLLFTMKKLQQAIQSLSDAILPPGIPPEPEVPPALQPNDMIASRARLEGAVARCAGGKFIAFLRTPSTLTAASKKISCTITGAEADAKEKNDAELKALNVQDVLLDILSSPDGAQAPNTDHRFAGLTVTMQPIPKAEGLIELAVSVNGGAQVPKPIEEIAKMLKVPWLPWTGRAQQPPIIPQAVGIPRHEDAVTANIAAPPILGEGPAGYMRAASLQIMGIEPKTALDLSQIFAGMRETLTDSRPIVIAIAAVMPAAHATDSPALEIVREHTTRLYKEFQNVIDIVTPEIQQEVMQGSTDLTAMGVTVGFSEFGALLRLAFGNANAKALLAGNLPPPPKSDSHKSIARGADAPPSVSALDAIIAAAKNGSKAAPAPDPCVEEAIIRLADSGLTATDMQIAVQEVADFLRTSGFAEQSARQKAISDAQAKPPIQPARKPSTPATYTSRGVTFSTNQLPVGLEIFTPMPHAHDTPRQVLEELAKASGREIAHITAMLARVVKRDPADEFFALDVDHDVAEAITDIATITEGETTWGLRPSSWDDAAARLRTVVSAFSQPSQSSPNRGTANGSSSSKTEEKARGTQVKAASAASKKELLSASSIVIGGLTDAAIISAERAAVHYSEAVDEARRLAESAYSHQAIPYLASDGTFTGSMPGKGRSRATYEPN